MNRISKNPYVFDDRVGDLDFPADDPKSKSMTQQNFAEEVDVNTIVNRAIKSGVLADSASMAGRVAIFGDFSGVGDFKSCLDKVIAAQGAFNDLPLDIKQRFNFDPGAIIDFLADPKNVEEAVKLGLLPKSIIEAKDAAAKAAEAAEKAAAAAKANTAAGTPAGTPAS